ncbi:MAG: redox-regulated ATPase YchF [Candidatus Cloacimonadota bacterium]|nr:redox-regulated ATPase YchF [Candidatus Cloacimonadota bacterium]
MKIGLIGLQNSGKTTIFNALTGLDAETANYSNAANEPNVGMVEVEDERVTKLSQIYKPQKTIYATIEFMDFVGLTGDKGEGDIFPPNSMALIKNSDAVAVVVRNFSDEVISQTQGKLSPAADVAKINSELIFSDFMIAEKRLEKISLNLKRGVQDSAAKLEKKALTKVVENLEKEIPIRDLELTESEEKSIRGFQFITQKPLMIILNSDEDNFGNNDDILANLNQKYSTIEFAGRFEMELSKLDTSEAADFMEDMGIKGSARERLTKFAYNMLGLISFFTVGKDEVRAWTIKEGDDAVTAAGKIHSDLARGFIRTECFNFKDLIELGSEKAIKEKGKLRLEGKKYVVQDGDILNIRFSV